MGAGIRNGLFFVVFLLCGQEGSAVTVLNMSHDLTTLGIAAQNLTPNNPSLDAQPLFAAAVQYIKSHPVQILTLDTGAYYFLSSQTSSEYLGFGTLSGITIDLAGSTLYFKEPYLYGFTFNNCTGVTLRNFSVDFVNAPYTHVQLTSVDSAQRRVVYQTLSGWPDPSMFNNVTPPFGTAETWAVAFRNGQMVPGTGRIPVKVDWLGQATPIANNTISFIQSNFSQPSIIAKLQPGDTLVVAERAGGAVIQFYQGDSIVLSDVTVYSGGALAVIMSVLSNSTLDHLKVMPRPNGGLISTSAGGVIYNFPRQNNHIRNSYVTRTLDDAFDMDVLDLARVLSQDGPRTLTVKRTFYNRFANGDALNFVDSATGAESSGGIVVSQNPPDSDAVAFNGEVVVTFDRDLPALAPTTGLVAANPELRGQGSTIEDNVAEDISAGRGIWLSGLRGVSVLRNLIRQTAHGGIVVSGDRSAFPGPPAHDLTIRDNRVIGPLGPMAQGAGTLYALGAIMVESACIQGPVRNALCTGAVNTNISITSNFIADSGRTGLWIGETSGGLIQNNFIARWNTHPELPIFGVAPQDQAILSDFSSALAFRYTSNVVSQNNQQTSLQTPDTSLVSAVPSSLRSGSTSTTLTLTGTFLPGSVIVMDGKPLQTTYIDSTQVTAAVPASLLVTGAKTLSVLNPDPAGTSSGQVLLQVFPRRRSQITSF